jgi:hypothetical protein
MSDPDGPEERTADEAEYFEGSYDAIERIEQKEQEDREWDESLLDVAVNRMNSHFLDRITGVG